MGTFDLNPNSISDVLNNNNLGYLFEISFQEEMLPNQKECIKILR